MVNAKGFEYPCSSEKKFPVTKCWLNFFPNIFYIFILNVRPTVYNVDIYLCVVIPYTECNEKSEIFINYS